MIVVLRNVSHTPLLWRRKNRLNYLGEFHTARKAASLGNGSSLSSVFFALLPLSLQCGLGTYSICCTPQFPEFDAGERSNSKQDSAFFSGTLRGKGDRAEIYDPSPPLQIEDQNFPHLLLCLNGSAALIYKERIFLQSCCNCFSTYYANLELQKSVPQE